jgi:site-specific DNA recombinase
LPPARLPDTLEALAAAQLDDEPPDAASLKEEIETCSRQLTQYRAALDGGADPIVAGQWITQAQASKVAAEARYRALAPAAPALQLTRQEVAEIVSAIGDLLSVLGC